MLSVVQSLFSRWYNRLQLQLCSLFSGVYLIKPQVDNLTTLLSADLHHSFLYREALYKCAAQRAQPGDQFTIPQPLTPSSRHGESSSWSGISLSSEVTVSIWVCRLTAPLSRPAPTLLPRGPARVLCNILIGRFVWCGRGEGRGPAYCDLTISCFVRSTFWSEDQLEAAINRRKTCSGKHWGEEEKKLQMLWSENSSVTFLHEALLLRRKPFIFVLWCFNYLT